MSMEAKTIQIYLPDGEPRGIRIAEVTTRIVHAVQFPRTRLDRILGRSELNQVGIYFLFGENDDLTKPRAYIGQTEDFKNRFRRHEDNKDFWTTAVFVASKTQSFTSSHIKYLEWHAIQQAKSVDRFVLDNLNGGAKPYVTEPMLADILEVFETASLLLSTLGFPIFDPVLGTPKSKVEKDTYECHGPEANGFGKLVEDGFVVLKGSVARKEIAPSGLKYILPRRDQLVSEGILKAMDSGFEFQQDHLFGSPSTAAQIILGNNINGWRAWKNADGKSLDEVVRNPEPSV